MTFDVPVQGQDKIDIKPMIEIRERFERRINRDFSDATADKRTDFLTRIRVGATGTYGTKWSFALQYQYAHDWILKSSSKATDEGSDLSLGYAQYKSNNGTVTVGRQKINLGTERLIGSADWVNVSRSMDGARYQNKELDVFAFKLGVGQPKPTDARVLAASKTWKWGQTSYVFKHDQAAGRVVDLSTVSHWMNKTFGQWTIDAEAALQFGKNQGKAQRAWAWHSSVTHPLGSKTRGFVELNAASGGSNSDTNFTFDNLYPTNHKFYGNMDLQAWKNMTEIAVGVAHKLNARTDFSASWRSFTLRDSSDAWYGAGGIASKGTSGDFIDPTGQSGRNVGWELDLDATYRATKNLTLVGGVGLFQPGSFVKSLNGGSAAGQHWLFIQGTFKF